MEGIQFVVDAQGKKTAVIIDLKQYGELWEDLYDAMVAQSRTQEPRETLEEVKQALLKQGKLSE